MIKAFVRQFIPESLISLYHFCLAHMAAFWYRYPSKELIVIGVTGTNGKSSTVQFIGQLLESQGVKVGWTTTVGFKVGAREWVNAQKMTMVGRFQTQKLLREMVNAGCTHAIIETSSQGIVQFRHVGIAYDVGVFTNLTPEHIEAHGGFEAYKAAKGKLFSAIAHAPRKLIQGHVVPKATVVNGLDPYAAYFLSFQAGEPFVFGPGVEQVEMTGIGTSFVLEGTAFCMSLIGRFTLENVLAAMTVCRALGWHWTELVDSVARLRPIPGRLEVIDEGQSFGVIVDYAPEPAALKATYQTIDLLGYKRLIHVLGSTGGGRDVARREQLGRMAAEKAVVVIVTNEDPYDDDPMTIIDDVAQGACAAGKQDGIDLWRILDRQEAINKAMSCAQAGDLVLITGKGSEPVMAVAHGVKMAWDDREAARKALRQCMTITV